MFCTGFRQHISPDVLGNIFATNHTQLLLCFYFLQGSGAHTNLSKSTLQPEWIPAPPNRGKTCIPSKARSIFFVKSQAPKMWFFSFLPHHVWGPKINFPKKSTVNVGDVSKNRDTLKPWAFNEPYQFRVNLGWSLNWRHTMTHPYFGAVHCRVCFNIRPPVRQAWTMFFWGLGMNSQDVRYCSAAAQVRLKQYKDTILDDVI